MGVNASATIAALGALADRMNEAARRTAEEGADLFKVNVAKEAPIGTPGNTTNPPGDLAASVDVTGPAGGDGSYTALIGPTAIYARQRELGGAIYPVRAAALAFTKFGIRYVIGPGITSGAFGDTLFINRPGVYQEPDGYTLRGYLETLPALEGIAVANARAAIMG
jgi:hypothetical protein